jgi:hypothetical protein
MKTLFTLLFALINLVSFTQINYQAQYAISGVPVSNTLINIEIDINDLTLSGTTIYSETFTPTTNATGIFTIVIGTGNVISNNPFSSINWSTSKFIELKINNVSQGTTQFMSVPNAFHAKIADSVINLPFDFNFPDGFNFNSPVLLSNVTSYTVPAGKNLYITNWLANPYFNFTINSVPFPSIATFASAPMSNFVLGEGMTLLANNSMNIIGFLTNNTIQYVTFNLTLGNYVVPNNKVFIPCYSGDLRDVKINNINFSWINGAIDENSEISGTGGLLGYLKDK